MFISKLNNISLINHIGNYYKTNQEPQKAIKIYNLALNYDDILKTKNDKEYASYMYNKGITYYN